MSGSITIGNIVKYTGSINQFMAGSGMVLMAIVGLKANNQYLQLYMDFFKYRRRKI